MIRKGSLLFLLGGSSGSFLGGLLQGTLGLDTGEDLEVRVAVTDWLDGTALDTVLDECAGNGAVDLELFDEGSTSNAENFCHFLRNLFVAFLVKEDIIVKLILDLDLSPALLLGLTATLLLELSALGRSLAFGNDACLFFFRLHGK